MSAYTRGRVLTYCMHMGALVAGAELRAPVFAECCSALLVAAPALAPRGGSRARRERVAQYPTSRSSGSRVGKCTTAHMSSIYATTLAGHSFDSGIENGVHPYLGNCCDVISER